MEIGLLGPLVVTRDDRPLGLGGAQPRLLLALLALDPGRVVGVDRLVDGIWGANLPGEPANALQVVVSRLRRPPAAPPLPLGTPSAPPGCSRRRWTCGAGTRWPTFPASPRRAPPPPALRSCAWRRWRIASRSTSGSAGKPG